MAELDAQVRQLAERELDSGDQILEVCTAGSAGSILPQPWQFLIPASIIGFAILSTKIGALSLVSVGIIVFSIVWYFKNYRRYILAPTERCLLIIQVASNLQDRIASRKLPYEKILSLSETGSGAIKNLEIMTSEETIKLMLATKERRISDSAERSRRVANLLRTKTSSGSSKAKGSALGI
ncbi:MAG TPA: hypothetical protein VFA60_05400 [Terriglobales bacterium]|nr:hypothetical protein [Terriglobales bacterium]